MAGHSEEVSRDPCGMVRRWALSPLLASMLVDLDGWACRTFDQELKRAGLSAPWFRWPGLFIVSGYRREPVVSAFQPTLPAAKKSRHRRLPSLAADLRVGHVKATQTPIEVWTFLGLHWERQGGRWGGNFRKPDPNHFDIDPLLVGEGLDLPPLVLEGPFPNRP